MSDHRYIPPDRRLSLRDEMAEQALLGALLLLPAEVWPEVCDLVTPALFPAEPYRSAAEVVIDRLRSNRSVDPVQLYGELVMRKQDGAIAFELAKGVGTASGARHYAERLRERWALREMREAASEILQDEQEYSVEEKLSKAVARFQGIDLAKTLKIEKRGAGLIARLDAINRQRSDPRNTEAQIPTGFANLDRFIGGLRPGRLAVFAARPGVGKSSFAVALAESLGERGIPTGVFWLEDELDDYHDRVIGRLGRIGVAALRNPGSIPDDRFAEVGRNLERGIGWPIWVDDTHGMTAQQMALRMRRMARQHGIRVFLADHLGEIKVEQGERWGQRHDLALGSAARTFRDAAKDLRACPVLFVQANREKEKSDAPALRHLFGSGEIEQVARVVGFLDRPEKDGQKFTIDLVKNTQGPPTQVEMRWIPHLMSVEENEPVRFGPSDEDDE